jgi:hypothetical protein
MIKTLVAVTLATALSLGATVGSAEEPAATPPHAMGKDMGGMKHEMGGMPGMSHGGEGHGGGMGMMGKPGGMHDMHEMMAKHGGMMAHCVHVPQLPPGNEKAQLLMQAEIMQKIGEVVAKHAGQLSDKK